MTTGVDVKVGVVTTDWGVDETAIGGDCSDPQAARANSATTARTTLPNWPTGLRLVLVALVVVPGVIVARVVVACVIMPGLVVAREGRPGLRRRTFVPVRRIDGCFARVGRVVVAERYAFEGTGRAATVFGLTEGNIVRWLAFEDEICRLYGR